MTQQMDSFESESANLIPLIYETAEDLELWPRFFEAYQTEASCLSSLQLAREQSILTHLDRAFRFNERLRESQENRNSTSQLLNSLPVAVICVNTDFNLSYANDLARRLFQITSDFGFSGNKLTIEDKNVRTHVLRLINNCLANRDRGTDKKFNDSIKLDVRKKEEVSSRNQEKMITLSLFAQALADKNSCNLFIASNALAECLSERSLRAFYDLTPAEARLALLLASGYTLADIAEKNHLSQNTLRNQLKSIFSKTDTNRQAELVTLILSTPHLDQEAQSNQGSLSPEQKKPQGHTQLFQLRNGRQLSYQIFGCPDGEPVLYMHDVIAWRWWENTQLLKQHNIKLIQVLRPGFDKSSTIPDYALETWAEDINEFLLARNDTCLPVLGHSSGGLFALAFAHYFPERCQKLSIINSIAPIENLTELEGSEPAMSRLLLGFARFSPSLYRRFFPLLLKSIAKAPSEYLKNYISTWSTDDIDKVENSSDLAILADCFLESLQRSVRGLSDECVYAVSDWGFKLEDINVSCHIWRGESDRAIAPAISRKLERIPGCQLHIVPKAGHLLIKQNISAILKSLLEKNEARQTAGQDFTFQ